MAKSSAYLVRRAIQALALLVLIVAGLSAPHQAFAVTKNLNAAPALEGSSLQLRSPAPQALDRSFAGRCALKRKETFDLAETQKQGAASNDDTPADAYAIVTGASLNGACPVHGRYHVKENCGLQRECAAAFQSRAPPSLTHC